MNRFYSNINCNYLNSIQENALISTRPAAEQYPNVNSYAAQLDSDQFGNIGMNPINHDDIAILQQAMAGSATYNISNNSIVANSVTNRGALSQSNSLYYNDAFLPPGYRFHPTDEELIVYYLANKIADSSFTVAAIAEADLNKCEPWDLPEKAKMGEKEWYFFSLKDRKYPTGLRTNRATVAGYWKATGKDKEIRSTVATARLVGMKKTLVFYRGRAPRGEKSDWVMHEYRLEGDQDYQYNHLHLSKCSNKDEWVVCRVFKKCSGRIKVISARSETMAGSSLAEPLPALQESPQYTVPAAYNNNHNCEDSGTTDHESTSTDQYYQQNQHENNCDGRTLITAGCRNSLYSNDIHLLNGPIAETVQVNPHMMIRQRDLEYDHLQTAQKICNNTAAAKIAMASTNSAGSCCVNVQIYSNDDGDVDDDDINQQKQKCDINLINTQKKLADQLSDSILHNIPNNPMIDSTAKLNSIKITGSAPRTSNNRPPASMEGLGTTKSNYYVNATAAASISAGLDGTAGPMCYESELKSIVQQYSESAMKLCKDETDSRMINRNRPNLEPYSCHFWCNYNCNHSKNTQEQITSNIMQDHAVAANIDNIDNGVINANPKIIKPQSKIAINQEPAYDRPITSQQLISSSIPDIWSSSAYYNYYINNSA